MINKEKRKNSASALLLALIIDNKMQKTGDGMIYKGPIKGTK